MPSLQPPGCLHRTIVPFARRLLITYRSFVVYNETSVLLEILVAFPSCISYEYMTDAFYERRNGRQNNPIVIPHCITVFDSNIPHGPSGKNRHSAKTALLDIELL